MSRFTDSIETVVDGILNNYTTATILHPSKTWAHLDSAPGYLSCQIGHTGMGRTQIAGSVISRICSMEG